MNWIKKLKLQHKINSMRSREAKLKNRYGRSGLAQQCAKCRWFIYREERPRNWVCRCPDDRLRFSGTVCLGFEPGEHPEMVMFNSR